MDFGICVQDLLNTKYLRSITKVVAGERGLLKKVSWVHILEIRDIVRECVNGGEMVLTTGIGFTTKEVAVNFLKELIDQKVSALCIEMPLYYHEMDREMIDLANQYDFPLIEITQISRFLDITKDLNTMLINNNAKLYHDADHYDNKLSDIRGTIADGIRYTAEYLDLEVAYLPIKGKQYGASPGLKSFIQSKLSALENILKDDETYCRGNIAIKHLKIFEKSWGYLVFNSTKRELSQFDILILNRLSNKIKNDLLEELTKKEEMLYRSNGWLKEWLEGSLSEAEIHEKLREFGLRANMKGLLVCCTTLCCADISDHRSDEGGDEGSADGRKSFDDFLFHTTIIVRRAFEDEGFSILGYMESNIISYIIMNSGAEEDIYERLGKAVGHLREWKNQFMDYKDSVFSIGKKVGRAIDVGKSYETAVETLKGIDGQCGRTVIYDRLYTNRLMEKLQPNVLGEFISDHLGALLNHESLELLQTLRVYFECHCSKQKTAEKLFIVRQTLYFRLQKIEDILGKDYDEGEKRFALEFALHAYFYKMEKAEMKKTGIVNRMQKDIG